MTETNCQYCNFDEYDVLDKMTFGVILPRTMHCLKVTVSLSSTSCELIFDITDKERKKCLCWNWHVMNSNCVINLQAFISVLMMVKYLGMCLEHLHIHIIPRYKDQELKLDARWGMTKD